MPFWQDEENVRKALDIERGLTEWEVEFVESVGHQVIDDERALTEKQRAKLDEILKRMGR